MHKKIVIIVSLFGFFSAFSQGSFPVLSDYLSDNIFLVHPSSAGIGSCGKLRITGRKQWQGIANAPELQTLSFHNSFGNNAAFGFIAFNDENGYNSQKGFQAAYAYHLYMGDGNTFKQLSFGLSVSMVQNQSDERIFSGDSSVQQIIESESYFNADFSVAYHNLGFSSYFTIKNLLLSAKSNLSNSNSLEPLNLKNYILSAGYYFNYREDTIKFEPSFMAQYREATGGIIVDFNIKAYKKFKTATFWAALSYRKGFNNKTNNQKYLTPILGVDYEKMMISYTYTKQLGNIVFSDATYHQITLGLNIFCKTPRASACPNINSTF